MPALLAVGVAAALCGPTAVKAQLLPPTLFNTGVDPTPVTIGGQTVEEDSHYLVTPPGSTTAVPLYVTDLGNLPYSPGDDATSSFISPQPIYPDGVVDPGGIYDFTTTFDLTGINLNLVSIAGRFEIDDVLVNVFLNGTPLGISLNNNDYGAFSPYFNLVPSAADLAQGTNTLTFEVYNYAGTSVDPTALRTEFLASVPEPSVWAAVVSVASVLLFGHWLRRRRATV